MSEKIVFVGEMLSLAPLKHGTHDAPAYGKKTIGI